MALLLFKDSCFNIYLLWRFKNKNKNKNLPVNAGDMRCGLDPWIGKIPWRRVWQPTPVFLPG